jgi:predicted component of type VI protein secretion system
MNVFYVADANGTAHDELTKAEIQQLFHGMEFAIGNFDSSVKAGHLQNIMDAGEQTTVRNKLVALREKLVKLAGKMEEN